MPKQQRPSVDSRMFDAAEIMLETSDAFNVLRDDIRTDLKWELADRFQKEYEAFCEEQKI